MRILAALVLLLAAAPALADERSQKYYYEDISHPFFAPDPARPGWYHSVRPSSVPSEFPVAKSTSAFRVFVLGGSIAGLISANGHGRIEQALAAALPGRDVQVMNCGMAGYESYREALIEQEVLEYSPDLLVFLTGHNEGIASAPIPIWVMKAQERLSRLAAFRSLVKTLHPDNDKDKLGTDERYDARDAAFERNLSANVRHARERGVAVALVVPPRNYREPTELGRTPYDAELMPGWAAYLRRDWAGARDAWTKSLDLPAVKGAPVQARRAFTCGFIGRAEEKLGRLEAARAAFEQAAALDRAAICGGICQGIIRRVAERDGAFLVEADKMFRAKAFPRMPGMETFNDRMHWKPKFNCLMSAEIIDAARANPQLKSLPWDEAAISALKASCVRPGGPGGDSDVDDDRRTLSYVLMGLSWPSFRRLSMVSVYYLEWIRRRRAEWFKDIPKMAVLVENPQTQVYGLKMAPDEVVIPRFHWHVGEVLMLDGDYAGAVKHLEEALKLDPGLHWAGVSLAAARALRGDKKAALAGLKETVASNGSDPNRSDLTDSAVALAKAFGLGKADDVAAADAAFQLDKAQAAITAGDKAAARAALDAARGLGPSRDQTRLIGQAYRLIGEDARFLEVSDQISRDYPEDADMWLSRAESQFTLGRKPEARESLARAEALKLDERQRRYAAGLRSRLGTGGGGK